ncbi:uncharacterized protein M6B38_195760 [Iris pallida]|uniref:TOD1/MUCI70 glycosyltransferase-like domain-containing protein n=1 Tax=Iris pallida TaxID=29817 RepID=A0AAX6ECQ9_IRIPA|nr:uncharacterized protein M6B38_195760 [Iris pallida]
MSGGGGGGSLGLRSGSYGSLQLHGSGNGGGGGGGSNGSSFGSPGGGTGGGAALPIQASAAALAGSGGRKNPKLLLPGAGSKERRVPWICKVASRRKVGMLLLFVASAAVLLSFIPAFNKDEDQQAGPETALGYSDHVWNFVNPDRISSNYLMAPLPRVTEDKRNSTSVIKQLYLSIDNETNGPVPLAITIPSRHPCEGFSIPPPTPLDRRRTGPRPCPVCYVPAEQALAYMPALPSESPVLKNLAYVSGENLRADEPNGTSIFGGHPSLQQREESYSIQKSMIVHCGFVKGKKPGQGTGFDIDAADLHEMEQCRGVVVASAIFGNYDIIQQPKNISETSKRTVCFYMFVDEETEAYIKNTTIVDSTKRVGLWRVVVIKNLPYSDARRNGKVPKLLLHRIFPNVRFSLWIDGKLELVRDPYQILERFLWRKNATFAISRHYRRFDVFVEAEANKAAGKYDNSSIDYQIEFYKKEGLTHYSEAKLPITSDVPEGCVIIREHIPITNLFTCLWFNEVDRFTSRDQLSFSTVRDRIMSKVDWAVNMFMDCERRNFVVQAYHRDLLEQRLASQNHLLPPPPPLIKESSVKSIPDAIPDGATRVIPSKKSPVRRGRRRRRAKGATSTRDLNTF